MHLNRPKRPSAALVISLVALFVALTGTAGAVVTAAVPLAKRALVADNAKRVNGVTAVQLGTAAAALGAKAALQQSPAGPRAASTASSLVSIKQAPFSLAANAQGTFTAACDAGQKAIAGGYANPNGTALSIDTGPTADGSGWSIFLVEATGTGSASGAVEVVCLK
jgi:hypothetical protein